MFFKSFRKAISKLRKKPVVAEITKPVKKYYWVLPIPKNRLDNEDYCIAIQKAFNNPHVNKHCRLDRLRLEIYESKRMLIDLPNTIYGITYDELQSLKQKNEQYC